MNTQTRPTTSLPGELMMWVLIFSELAVFGAGIAVSMVLRLLDPAGFAAAQGALLPGLAGINTILLITSGLFAALAVHQIQRARMWLALAAILGGGFLILKTIEFQHKAGLGITFETHEFFMFYYLLTGFHAAHVLAGIGILLVVAWTGKHAHIEAGAAFWHMVDLVWVLLFPVMYLL